MNMKVCLQSLLKFIDVNAPISRELGRYLILILSASYIEIIHILLERINK